MMERTPTTWEVPLRAVTALNAAAGPFVVATVALVFWSWVRSGGADGLDSERSRFWVSAIQSPVGSGLWLLLVTAIFGMAALILVAALRSKPALRLDEEGVTSWTELRLRRARWSEVRGIGIARGPRGTRVLTIWLRGSRSIRLHGIMFDESLDEVLTGMRRWIGEHRPSTVIVPELPVDDGSDGTA